MVEQSVVQILNGALNLIAAILVFTLPFYMPKIVGVVKAKWEEVLRNQPEFLRTILEQAAQFGIRYAEQKFAEDAGVREEKLRAAIEAGKTFLNSSGLKGISTEALEQAIESLILPTKLKIANEKLELEIVKNQKTVLVNSK